MDITLEYIKRYEGYGKSDNLSKRSFVRRGHGMPVGKRENSRATTAPTMRKAKTSHQVHQRTQVSRAVARNAKPAPMIQKRSDIRRIVAPSSAKSHQVTKFAPRVMDIAPRSRPVSDIHPATAHPIAKRAEERLQQARPTEAKAAVAMKPSSVIKKEAIDQALAGAPSHREAAKQVPRARKAPRFLSFASMALSLLLLAGYLTYINLPNLSVRVAANQAGIDASYPGYSPDGYRLAGVNYDQGSVSLKFAANAGPQNYTITQQQTSWDSTAVRENYVKTNWGDAVVPYSERGLTIYAHEGNAAWVNGGILYTITGDATLSTSQVRSIATSL